MKTTFSNLNLDDIYIFSDWTTLVVVVALEKANESDMRDYRGTPVRPYMWTLGGVS